MNKHLLKPAETLGFTLIEMMIAVSISLLLFTAFFGAFRHATRVVDELESLSDIQASKRNVFQMLRGDIMGTVFERTAKSATNAYANTLDTATVDLTNSILVILQRQYTDENGVIHPADFIYMRSASSNPAVITEKYNPEGEVMYYLGMANDNGEPSDDPIAHKAVGTTAMAGLSIPMKQIHFYRAVNYALSTATGPYMADTTIDDLPPYESQLARNVSDLEISVLNEGQSQFVRKTFVWPNSDATQGFPEAINIKMRVWDRKYENSQLFEQQFLLTNREEF